ncbi:filamentous hemagglutinin N-terminal domain-containing protein, partial [Nostoc sp. FACHB-110]|uniref:two-partner secretion domain-containing protein n=1 Tax=Nostoc sp. FACHB-110 TaxID=2692834 RepID=UPI001684AFDF
MSIWNLSKCNNLLGITIISVSTCFWNSANAQISSDITLPNNSRIQQQGNTFNITEGTQSGSNLFHSFREFSVPSGSEAFFNNGTDIQNIFSRVTGNSISNIDGLIRANGTANLFLINPNGIIFGNNARLNIGGSFLASTASGIKFSDNLEFSAKNPQSAPLLSINVPIGLQYGENPGNILNQSQILEVQPERTLALVGGDVTVEGGTLSAPSGRIELGGSLKPGEIVNLSIDGGILSLNFPDNLASADVSVNGAELNVVGNSGGSIALNARKIDILGFSTLEGGIGSGQSSVDGQAKDISLNATDAINIKQSIIQNSVDSSTTNGGDIRITAGELFVGNGTQLTTITSGETDAGNIFIDAKQKVLFDGTYAFTTVGASGIGNAGNIQLNTEQLTLRNGARLLSRTFGRGDAGNIFIDAKQQVLFDGTYSGAFTTVGASGIGKGGDIQLNTEQLTLRNGGLIAASTFGRGDAGNIFIDAKQQILFDGTYSTAFTTVGSSGIGKGGDIQLNTEQLTLLN